MGTGKSIVGPADRWHTAIFCNGSCKNAIRTTQGTNHHVNADSACVFLRIRTILIMPTRHCNPKIDPQMSIRTLVINISVASGRSWAELSNSTTPLMKYRPGKKNSALIHWQQNRPGIIFFMIWTPVPSENASISKYAIKSNGKSKCFLMNYKILQKCQWL